MIKELKELWELWELKTIASLIEYLLPSSNPDAIVFNSLNSYNSLNSFNMWFIIMYAISLRLDAPDNRHGEPWKSP